MQGAIQINLIIYSFRFLTIRICLKAHFKTIEQSLKYAYICLIIDWLRIQARSYIGYSVSNFIQRMSKIQDKYSSQGNIGMEEIKSTLLKANYEIDIGIPPSQLQNTSLLNSQMPYFKGMGSANYHMNAVQNSQTGKKNDSSSKRLKLKDYLHLNSIQKKSRPRTSTSSSFIGSENSLKSDQKMDKHSRLNSTSVTQSTSSPQRSTVQTFKEEINKQIQDSIKRLQDLANYLKNDHVSGARQEEDKLIFWDMHTALEKQAQMHEKLGEQLLKFQEAGPQSRRESSSKGKYFWEKSSKNLSSPAKLKEGLELTCLLFDSLGAAGKKK